jgi:hypothetical protein
LLIGSWIGSLASYSVRQRRAPQAVDGAFLFQAISHTDTPLMTPPSDAARLAARNRFVIARGVLRNSHERVEAIRTVYDGSAASVRRQITCDWQAATAEYGNAISDYVKMLATATELAVE